MGMAFLHGQNGGGSDLNFATKAYSTEAELLASTPKENTLGVVTNVPPSAWGFYNAAPGWEDAEGVVYFVVPLFTSVEAASFNATKKYRLWLAPTGCYQRISGAWKSITAYIYKDGSWLQFSVEKPAVFIIFDGENVANYTGGWSGGGSSSGGVLSVTNGGYDSWVGNSYLSSAELIDMSGYSTLHFIVSEYNRPGSKTFGLDPTADNGKYDIASVSVTGINEYTIDIQSVDSCFIKLCGGGFQAGSGGWESGGYAVSKIWLE